MSCKNCGTCSHGQPWEEWICEHCFSKVKSELESTKHVLQTTMSDCKMLEAQHNELKRLIQQEENDKSWRDDKLKRLFSEALSTDSADHKQWYLEQIAETLNIPLDYHEAGVAP